MAHNYLFASVFMPTSVDKHSLGPLPIKQTFTKEWINEIVRSKFFKRKTQFVTYNTIYHRNRKEDNGGNREHGRGINKRTMTRIQSIKRPTHKPKTELNQHNYASFHTDLWLSNMNVQ